MLDEKTFNAGLAIFTAHFPNLKFVDFNATAWYGTLRNEVDPAMYERAVMEVCKKPEWFPSDNFAGQVVDAANKLRATDTAEAQYKLLESPEPQPDPMANNVEFNDAMKMHRENRGKPDKESLARTREAQAIMERLNKEAE